MAGCRNKMAFRTVEQAEISAAVIGRIKGDGLYPKRLYACPKCSLFHWTSKDESEVNVAATTVAVVVPPVTAPRPPAPAAAPAAPKAPPEPGQKSRKAKHIMELEARVAREIHDRSWLKDRIRWGITLIHNGEVRRAAAFLEALVSLPKNLSPKIDPSGVEAFLEREEAQRIAYHEQRDGLKSAPASRGYITCAGGCGQALTTEEERRGNLCEGCATR